MCHTHGSESFPWVTLVIPRSIVRTVRITNRVDCCGERMENVKIWVGEQFPSTSNVEYSGGALLGAFSGPGYNGQVLERTSQTGVRGTHVVVQMETNIINLAEIEILGETIPEPDDCYCGLAKRKPTRILGGEETEVNEYPWQVFISTGCGGSLISDNWVLTAAHCVDRGWIGQKLKVWLGEHDTTDAEEADEIEMDVAEVIIHEKYNSSKILACLDQPDFALLRLTKKVDFGSHPHIRPICLPADGSDKDYVGYTATATGWGITKHNGPRSNVLMEVDLTVMTRTPCKSWCGGSDDQVLCAKGSSGKGICESDSGGPLITKDSGHSGTVPGQNYELIGVTSFTTGDTCENTLQGFARVTAQLEWIREKTKDSWRTCPRT